MSQNVSSVRVQIIGDSRGLNAELIKASKSVADFGNRTAKSSFQGLDSQLSQIQKQVTEVAESYVTGGKVQRSEIEKLITLEKRLQRQIEARDTALAAARGTMDPLGTVIGSSGGPNQLRGLNNELSTTHQRSGKASLAITQLGFAAEDAFTVMGNQGLAGALRAAGNNLSFVLAMFSPAAGVIGGVGIALSALLIPALIKSDEKTGALADTFRDLRKNIELTRLSLKSVTQLAADEPLSVEGIFEGGGGDRFQVQRGEFQRDLRSAKADLERATLERQIAMRSIGNRSQGLISASLPGLSDTIKSAGLRFGVQLQSATVAAIENGDASLIAKAFENRLSQAQRLSDDVLGIGINQTAVNDMRSFVGELQEFAQAEINARKEADKLREALSGLSQNEKIANLLKPVMQVGGRFEGLLNNLVSGFQADFGGTGTNERRNVIAQADPLQAGFQFGSVEAISAINRATFSRPNPTEKEIEKNTSETVDAVRDLAGEVKNMGSAIAAGIGNAIAIGGPL